MVYRLVFFRFSGHHKLIVLDNWEGKGDEFDVADTMHNLCDVGTLNVATLLIVSAVYSLYGLY